MSDSYTQDLQVPITTSNNGWTNIAATYTAMASVQSWVQNKGPGALLVCYSSSATAPTGGGYLLNAGDTFGGSAAYVWAKPLNGACTAAVGLV